MRSNSQDIWARWLLDRRDAGDPEQALRSNEYLRAIRDRVLDKADLKEGDILLDVGCGDGLIAFGALERLQSGTVIFSDVSQDLLRHAQAAAAELGFLSRSQFLRASAEDLSQLIYSSVDVVTTRSVLIYVRDKSRALREFHRVLKPGGRISLFEPINRFGYPPPDHIFAGYDVTEVVELARKVKDVYRQAQPEDEDPMIDFDERDLLAFAEQAGFQELHLALEIDIEPMTENGNWVSFVKRAPNPLAPTLEEAVGQSLTEAEQERFLSHLRPLVEQRKGIRRHAVAYVWGRRSGDG